MLLNLILNHTLSKFLFDELDNRWNNGKHDNSKRGKEQRAGDIIIEEPTIEYDGVEESTAIENNKPVAKGTTTAHFVRSISELLDIMNMDESPRVVIL
ncbi:hypothetical protein G6F37_008292 [Rhizopus arrhizus]|nr:hypothetical protein G6F38_008224 [Rhizopus arrhizus]KAG1155707.1 hypothetical protein G6F37_008292 [Rhizopus arrhizus]